MVTLHSEAVTAAVCTVCCQKTGKNCINLNDSFWFYKSNTEDFEGKYDCSKNCTKSVRLQNHPSACLKVGDVVN